MIMTISRIYCDFPFMLHLCFMLYRNGITHNMNSMTVRSDASKEDIKLFCKSIVGVQFHGETSNHHSNKVKFLMATSLSFFQICCDIFQNSKLYMLKVNVNSNVSSPRRHKNPASIYFFKINNGNTRAGVTFDQN